MYDLYLKIQIFNKGEFTEFQKMKRINICLS